MFSGNAPALKMFVDSDEDENKAFAVQHDNSTRTMSAKVAPSYNGNTSWFQYEELIDEWCDLTTIEASKRGPNLKSRLFWRGAIFESSA